MKGNPAVLYPLPEECMLFYALGRVRKGLLVVLDTKVYYKTINTAYSTQQDVGADRQFNGIDPIMEINLFK